MLFSCTCSLYAALPSGRTLSARTRAIGAGGAGRSAKVRNVNAARELNNRQPRLLEPTRTVEVVSIRCKAAERLGRGRAGGGGSATLTSKLTLQRSPHWPAIGSVA